MTLKEAISTGKPFRRPCWVEPEDEIQWCLFNFEHCDITWEDGSVFGDITPEMLLADDFEVKEMQ